MKKIVSLCICFLSYFPRLLYRCIDTATPTTASIATTCILVWKTSIPAPKVSHKVNKNLFSCSGGIPFLEKYDRIYGDKYLLVRSIFTPLFDERMYRPSASRRKGVVGIMGRNIPANPNPTHNKANAIYRCFLIFFLSSQRYNLNLKL